MHTPTPPRPAVALPRLDRDGLVALLTAGAVGTIAFDIWGQAVAPALGLGNLAPVPLARGTLALFLGLDSEAAAHFMHLFLVGLVAYPLGWLGFRAVAARMAPGLSWLAVSALYGFGLWLFAIGLVASTVTGAFFLNFTTITWLALVGHVLYGIVCAASLAWLERR
jgi:hypothetical protein